MATTSDVLPSRDRDRKRRKKRASLDFEERENNSYERQSVAPDHFPLHDLADGAPDKMSPQNPQSTSNNSAEGSFGLPQGDRKTSARTRRPRRRAKMENGELYDEEAHVYDTQGERKRYSRRPPSGVKHGVRRSASAEIIGAYEDYAVNGEGLSPNRRRPRRKRVHGSREFGEGEEFIEDPQATNTLSREQRDYEKRQKPRKHKQKKPASSFRVQNVTSAEEDNYNADIDGEVSEAFFKVDKEDIVNEAPSQTSTAVSAPVPLPLTANAPQAIPSQPLDMVFIERMDGRGFRSERKSRLAQTEAEIRDISPTEHTKQATTAEFALSVHKAFRSFSLFCHGLLAGLALAQCIFVYSLSSHPSGDTVFLTYYHTLAQPVQSLYYMLFAICTVSVFDRYDMANPRSGFFQGLLTRPSRILAISAYLFALVFSISVANIDDRISLYSSHKENLWKESEMASLLETWRIINLMRVLGAVLGWVLISLQPSKDYTAQNLYADVDPVVGEEATRSRPSTESRQPQMA